MWFKVLNPEYAQKRGRKEMFEYYAAAPKGFLERDACMVPL
jgi:hypothetical protein